MLNFYTNKKVQKKMTNYYNPNFETTQMKHPFYAGIVACGGGGKTNCLLNLIFQMSIGNGTWSHIYIVHKMDEPLYDHLADQAGKDNITFYKNMAELPAPNALPMIGQTLLVFDDQISEGKKAQQAITDYFIRARKLQGFGCSCIIISQAYYPIPKTIRGQFHYLLLLKLKQKRDLDAVLRDCSTMNIAHENPCLF